jgi:hypothetical protein
LIVLIVRSLLLAIFAPALLSQVAAQTNPCLERAIPVSVYSKKGDPVWGLTAPSFKASIRGKPIQVTSATYDNTPRQIVIAVDRSGSMAMNNRVELGLEVGQALVSASQPGDSFALLTFGGTIECMVPFGLSRAVVFKEIARRLPATPRP